MSSLTGKNAPTEAQRREFTFYHNKIKGEYAKQTKQSEAAQVDAALARKRLSAEEIERQVDAEVLARLKDPAFGAPLLRCFGSLATGQMGVFQEVDVDDETVNFQVGEVVDAENMVVRQLEIVNAGTRISLPVWIQTIETTGYGAGDKILLGQIFEVTGTREYAGEVVLVIEPRHLVSAAGAPRFER